MAHFCSEEIYWILGAPLSVAPQLANPAIATGTHRHSHFNSRLFSRFRRTVVFSVSEIIFRAKFPFEDSFVKWASISTERRISEHRIAFIYKQCPPQTAFLQSNTYRSGKLTLVILQMAFMCGSPEDRETIYKTVSCQHASVRGIGYDANNAELQLWTAATLFFTARAMHEIFADQTNPWEEEELCLDFAVFGTSLNVPKEMWFKSLTDFEEYWNRQVAELEISEDARVLGHMLMYGMNLPWYLSWLLFFVRALLPAWLPPRFRKEHWLPDPDKWINCGLYHIMVTLLRVMNSSIPRPLRHMASSWIKRDVQRVAGDIRRTGSWAI